MGPALAFVVPTPAPSASASPSAAPAATNVLPFDSPLTFVLDQPLSSSASRADDLVPVHLKDPIVVGGRVLAPAGTPGVIRVIDVSASQILDVYGFVDIYFEPLHLSDGRLLPLRAPASRLSPHVTNGHESTVEVEDTIGGLTLPYYTLWQIFRKGKNFVLKSGSEIPARTEATLLATANGTVAIETPRPLVNDFRMPKPTFPVEPAATPFGPAAGFGRDKHASPLPSSSPAPSPVPTPSASPSPAAER